MKDNIAPGYILIHNHPNEKYTPNIPDISSIKFSKPHLDTTNFPFDSTQVLSIEIKITPSGESLRTLIEEDAIFNVPYILHFENELPLFYFSPDHAWKSMWIVAIEPEEPITDYSAEYELCLNHNRSCINNISISINQHKSSSSTNHQYMWATVY